jgi:PAS domain S-box-containing protein
MTNFLKSIHDISVHSPLRKEAEARLRRLPTNPAHVDSPERLLHELRVHQVELEIQNEQLRSAQVELALMRDRYVDLYEFAPIAYITLTASGEIVDINQTGALLLAAERGRLRHGSFEHFVMADDQAKWRQFLGDPRVQRDQQTCELRMRRKDGTIFFGNLCSSLVSGEDGLPELRIALTDVSERKYAEQARRKLELRLYKLTKREREVLVLALSGMINKDISEYLRISQRAVENYRSRIHVKTESVSLLELSHQVAIAGITLDEITLPE